MNPKSDSPPKDGIPFFEFVLSENYKGRFLDEAFVQHGSASPQPLNLDLVSRNDSFRAIFISMLLAKYRGLPDVEDKIWFTVKIAKGTWIHTLAGFYHDSVDNWFQTYFKMAPFVYASGGTTDSCGDLYPYAFYRTKVLPLENIRFVQKAGDADSEVIVLEGDELEHYATNLEKFRIEKHKKWKQTVERLLHGTLPSVLAKRVGQKYPIKNANERAEFLGIVKKLIASTFQRMNQDGIIDWFKYYKKTYPFLCNFPLTQNGDTPLILAILFRQEKVVDYLLGLSQIEVNCTNKKGVTPLLKATSLTDFATVKRLVKMGANLNARNKEGANGVYEAAFGASHESLSIIKYLSGLGVSVNVFCRDGSSALSVAYVRHAPGEVINYLMACHCDADTGKMPYLPAPSAYPKPNKSQYLDYAKIGELASRLNLKLGDAGEPPPPVSEETRAMFIAASAGDAEAIESLLKWELHAIDINFEDSIFKSTAVHEAAQIGNMEIAENLLNHGADPFVQNAHGKTPRELIPRWAYRLPPPFKERGDAREFMFQKMTKLFEEKEIRWAKDGKVQVNLFF